MAGAASVQETSNRAAPAAEAAEDTAKRRQILAGAYRVFLESGYDAASMNDITRAAGVSKGTIYAYFGGKAELFEAVVEAERSRVTGDLLAVLEPDRPVAEVLSAFGRGVAALALRDDVIRAQRTVIAVAERMPELGRRFYEEGPQRLQAALAGWLQAKAESGELRIADATLAAAQFSDMCSGTLTRERLYGFPPGAGEETRIAAIVDAAVAVFLKAYAAEDG